MSIPKKIYQSWKTLDLPPKMREAVDRVKELNPEYEHELWDDKMSYEFLRDNFGQNYANAFDVLIPGAFKSDLWRYAILYVYGGVYMDIDMIPLIPFNQIIEEGDRFVSVKDRPKGAIYQAFIACEPKHPILLYSLKMAFYNVVNRIYKVFGDSLSITGTIVAGIAFNLYFKKYKTRENIKEGRYPNGIKLFKFNGKGIIDLNGKMIFTDKYEGYKSISPYEDGFFKIYYKDDPKKYFKKIIKYLIIGILIFILVFFILFLVFRIKFKKCEKSCSR